MEDMQRYARNIALPQIGAEGQRRICSGRVLLVGCGALGSAVGLYLAGSGVGTIGLADFDTVDITNLQRQVAYAEEDAGISKARCLAGRLRALNSTVRVNTYLSVVTPDTFADVASGYDIVADCSDNPATKHFLPQAATASGKPCVSAGVGGFVAQVTTSMPGAVTFADIFGDSGGDSPMIACGSAGVFGPAAGVAATLQAAEVLKILAGAGSLLSGRLLVLDTLTMQSHTFEF